jgi:hypothetical protein
MCTRVFKKRPYYADGAQIAIVSKMWLLRFLSGKFWRQTAVSPHSTACSICWATASDVRIQLCNSLRNNACVWNSASNFGKRLWKHLNHWSKFTGRNVWVVRNTKSGLRVSKRVEHQSVRTRGLDDLPHQQMTAMSREFVRWFVEIVVWQSKRLLRRWTSV